MADGGKVIIKIDGDDAGFQKSAKNVSSVFSKIGGAAKGAFGAVAAGTTVAAGAIVGIGTAAVKAYSEHEQLAGGVQKIFNEIDYSKVANDAGEAYKTMGMSANQYMQVMTTVGANFASTLGDAKGYEVAKQGMQAISDFASGTGRSVDELSAKYQMITKSSSSYQSIADQFAGILPATSAEFLKQAQAAGILSDSYKKITDVPMPEYQQAVTEMMMQGVDALGLTSNTANEAFSTISGSAAMMKASWENLLVGLADPTQNFDALIQNFMTSVEAFATNLMPVIGNVLSALPEMIESLGTKLFEALPGAINDLLPQVAECASNLINVLVATISENSETIGQTLSDVLTLVVDAITSSVATIASNSEGIMNAGLNVAMSLINSISDNLPTLLPAAVDIFFTALNTLLSNADQLNAMAQNIAAGLGEGLINSADVLVEGLNGMFKSAMEQMIGEFSLAEHFKNMFKDGFKIFNDSETRKGFQKGGATFIKNMADGMTTEASKTSKPFDKLEDNATASVNNISATTEETLNNLSSKAEATASTVSDTFGNMNDAISKNINEATNAIVKFEVIDENLANITDNIVKAFDGIDEEIAKAFDGIGEKILQAFDGIETSIGEKLQPIPAKFTEIANECINAFNSVDFTSLGSDIISGIVAGVNGSAFTLYQALRVIALNALEAAKSALNINSPSRLFRDEVGRWIPRGIAVGIEMASGFVEKSLDKVFEKIGKKTDNEMSDVKKRTDEYAKQISEIFDITSTKYVKGGILLNPGDEYGHHDILRFMKAETLELKKQAKTVQEIYDIHLAYFNKLEADTKMQEWPYRGEWQKYRDEAFDELLELEEDLLKIEEETISDLDSKISEHYQHMTTSAINAIDAVEQKQKELTSKISSNFKLLEQAENGRLSLANLSKHSEGMAEYYNNLKRLKEVAPKELYEEILGMSTQEGGSFMYTFFAASQTEQQKFIDDYKNIYTQAAEGAKNAFVEETADVEKQIMDEFSKTPEDFFQIGKDSLKKFGEGFYENLSEMMSGIRNTMSSLLGNLFPQVEYAGVGSRVYNDNSNITIIAGSKSERDMIEELEQRKLYEQQVRGW